MVLALVDTPVVVVEVVLVEVITLRKILVVGMVDVFVVRIVTVGENTVEGTIGVVLVVVCVVTFEKVNVAGNPKVRTGVVTVVVLVPGTV